MVESLDAVWMYSPH